MRLIHPVRLALVVALLCSAAALTARDRVIPVRGAGPFTLGSMNLSIDADTLAGILAAGGNAGDYLSGANANGRLLYITTLLAHPNDAFTVPVNVPNDPATYGSVAGQTLTYAGIVIYPTTPGNGRPDATIIDGTEDTLPHMQAAGEAPMFADPAARYPLIVYSHGTGTRPSIRDVTFIASHGYVVVALYHGDNRFDRTSAEQFNLRPLAVKHAIDAIGGHPAFATHLNLDQIGGVGTSFGGATMLALIGGKTLSANVLATQDFTPKTTTTDLRLKATAGLVPYLGDATFPFFGIGGTGASTVVRPYMAVAGTADATAPIPTTRQAITNIPGAKYLIEMAGEGHDFSATAVNEAFTWVMTYLDAAVKQDPAAKDTLRNAASVAGGVNDAVTIVTDLPGTPGPAPGPPGAPGLPGAPPAFACAVAGFTVTCTWGASTVLGPSERAAASSYNFKARQTAGGPVIFTQNVGSQTTFGGAGPAGTYVLSVAGVNAQGTEGAESVTQTVTLPGGGGPPPACTTPPDAPTGLASTVSGASITLRWNTSTGCPATSYGVRATVSGAEVANVDVGNTTEVTGTLTSATYVITVVGRNAHGDSAPSAPTTAVVP